LKYFYDIINTGVIYMSKILIVVDMQNDFIDGALGTKEAQAIVPKVITKIKNHKGQVMYTRDTHEEGYLETQEGKKLPVEHCLKGTSGWELETTIGALAKERSSMIFDKPAFGAMNLAGCLHGINKVADVNEVELIGLCTDICVISNAILLKSALPECRILVDSDCCAGVTPESHHNALKAMKMCQIDVN